MSQNTETDLTTSEGYKLGWSQGLQLASVVMCEHCLNKNEPEFKAGAWFHHNVQPRIEYTGCKAGPILDLLKGADEGT